MFFFLKYVSNPPFIDLNHNNFQMYSLTIQHNSQTLHIRWSLQADDDDETVVIEKLKYTPHEDYSVCVLDDSLTISVFYKKNEIIQLYFHPERIMYFLRFIHSGSVVREYYLEDDLLDAKQKYSVVYSV